MHERKCSIAAAALKQHIPQGKRCKKQMCTSMRRRRCMTCGALLPGPCCHSRKVNSMSKQHPSPKSEKAKAETINEAPSKYYRPAIAADTWLKQKKDPHTCALVRPPSH
eukprot:843051-Pelagomonas_calceolata.AAC.4